MTIARAQLVDPTTSGLYHCISRCVRRAFLCGDGCDHRKGWIHQRLRFLASVFAVDVGGFAILDNHFHTVLRTHPERAASWSSHEVVTRAQRLFPQRVRQWALEAALAGTANHRATVEPVPRPRPDLDHQTSIDLVAGNETLVAMLRQRLSSLSWFMKCLKERIARDANREDRCTGHFWEARFKSFRILDLPALLTTLLYVDLNVIRASLARAPEQSGHTSAQERIRARRARAKGRARKSRTLERRTWLAPIDRQAHRDGLLDMTLDEYLVTLDCSGRLIREGKKGAIPEELAPILERLEVDAHRLATVLRDAGRLVGTVVGGAGTRLEEAARRGARRVVATFDVSPPG